MPANGMPVAQFDGSSDISALHSVYNKLCQVAWLLGAPENPVINRISINATNATQAVADPFDQNITFWELKNLGTHNMFLWYGPQGIGLPINYITLLPNEWRSYDSAPPALYIQGTAGDILEYVTWS